MKKQRKIPYRKCVATHALLPKSELIRVVRTPEKQVVVDLTHRQNGRGAYLQKGKHALDIAIKKNALSKALAIEVPEAIYKELQLLIEHD